MINKHAQLVMWAYSKMQGWLNTRKSINSSYQLVKIKNKNVYWENIWQNWVFIPNF